MAETCTGWLPTAKGASRQVRQPAAHLSRSAYERATSDFYELNIKPALVSSRFLIVVATPNAMRRPKGGEDWIEREIRDFIDGEGGKNVIAVRGAGEFDGPLPGSLKRL